MSKISDVFNSIEQVKMRLDQLQEIFKDVIVNHIDRKKGFGYPDRIMFIDVQDGFISNFKYDGFRPQIGEVWQIPKSSHHYGSHDRVYVKIIDVVYELIDCGDVRVFCQKVEYPHDRVN